jgi:hypothetical protein
MSTRAKWIACLGAFAVGGLVASIPAFLGSSERRLQPKPVASYRWFDRLPVSESSPIVNDTVVLAKASDGQKLLAGSLGGEQLCLTLGHGGGGCAAIDRSKQIQLVARDASKSPTVVWGVLADDVMSVLIRHDDGSVRREHARRAFGAIGRVESVTALDGKGNELGSVRGDAFAPMGCRPTSCYTSITFSN